MWTRWRFEVRAKSPVMQDSDFLSTRSAGRSGNDIKLSAEIPGQRFNTKFGKGKVNETPSSLIQGVMKFVQRIGLLRS
jgi:hypothetical protein